MSSVNPPQADAVPPGCESAPAPGAAPRTAPGSQERETPRHPAARSASFWRTPFTCRTWAEFLYAIFGVPLAGLGFSLTLAFTVFGAGLSVLVFGLFVFAFAPVLGRWFGALDRGLLNGLLGERIAKPRPFKRTRRGLLGWPLSRLGDKAGWRGIAFELVRLPLALVTAATTGLVWAYALFGMTYWIWYRWTPLEKGSDGRMHRGAAFGPSFILDTWPRVLLTAAIGLLLFWLAPWVTRGLVGLERALGRGLLGPVSVTERVRELEQTRSEAVTSSNEHLRKIERDLHDGTQARLVALAMNLGQAREDLSSDDPAVVERARTLIEGAHQQTKETLTELRDIARGIHPPILDNGLESALTSLGSRSPIRVNLTIDLPERPSATAETITYFAIAELLTNAVKHSTASAISVRLRPRGEQIVFSVSDNGRGGALLGGGSGLDGVRRRLAAVDGTLDLDSPLGGPTTATGTLPLRA